MKTFLLLLAASLWGLVAQAQAISDAQVPPLAFVALQKQYPEARHVKWKRVQDWYQASYTQGQAFRLVRFSPNGDVEATGVVVEPSTLPPLVRHTLTNYYPSRIICQAAEITNARTGDITYELATCESFVSSTIVLTANGRKVPRPRRQ